MPFLCVRSAEESLTWPENYTVTEEFKACKMWPIRAIHSKRLLKSRTWWPFHKNINSIKEPKENFVKAHFSNTTDTFRSSANRKRRSKDIHFWIVFLVSNNKIYVNVPSPHIFCLPKGFFCFWKNLSQFSKLVWDPLFNMNM